VTKRQGLRRRRLPHRRWLNIIYELAAFVIADGIGANLERADIIGRVGHGALLILAGLLCAASIGLRTRKDEKAVRRILSAFVFGSLSGLYVFGLTLVDHETTTALGLAAIVILLGGLGAAAVSAFTAKILHRAPFSGK